MNKCLMCSKDTKTKFCSNKCSATYQNTNYHWRRQKGVLKNATCTVCGSPMSYRNKNCCSSKCSAQLTWKTKTVPMILKGLAGVSSIKRYLVETRGDKCQCCGVSSLWNNKRLILQLDHVDGNSDNNKLENLRLLCPNCHSQTDTYGSKGNGNRYKKITKRNTYLQEYKASVV